VNRLFKSALFPILVVLVLAFFALKIVNSSSSAPGPTWSTLVAATNAGRVSQIKTDLAGNSVTYYEGQKTFSVGIPSIGLLNQELALARTQGVGTINGTGSIRVRGRG